MTDAQKVWWDTYNAVLGGMWQNPQLSPNGPQYLHLQATAATETAHGAYPPDAPVLPLESFAGLPTERASKKA